MSCLEDGLRLIQLGFRIFPCEANGKRPLIKDFPRLASSDPQQAGDWNFQFPGCNWGIATGGELFAIDADIKGNGLKTLRDWELIDGLVLPLTYEQHTPSGGMHVLLTSPVPIANSVKTLGPGLDVRGQGGYVLGRGSSIDGKAYRGSLTVKPAPAPEWLLAMLTAARPAAPAIVQPPPPEVRQEPAVTRARALLAGWPAVPEGKRNAEAYKAAAQVRLLGVELSVAIDLMRGVWNINALPPLTPEEIEAVTTHAYTYAHGSPGEAAPEVEFAGTAPAPRAADLLGDEPEAYEALNFEAGSSAEEAIERINEEYAVALAGSNLNVLWFTTDEHGNLATRFLGVDTFHQHRAGWKVEVKAGEDKTKVVPLTRLWMGAKNRRTYDGVVFAPEQKSDARFFNLWRGFAVTAAHETEVSAEARWAFAAWKEHLHENAAAGNAEHARWITAWFAHMIQRPWEKPLVALVLRGDKGVGKDSLVDPPGSLLGAHYFRTAKRRHLVGDFNSHLENVLLFNANEAFWAHDHQVEGTLKDLITGREHIIERKGQEPYPVKNLMRIVIMGNADTIVPSTWDERRWAAFQVVCRTHQARTPAAMKHFERMRLGMEGGGNRLLLAYLRNFDLSAVNVNAAPKTELLHEQTLEGLPPLQAWWLESIREGRLLASDLDGWPTTIDTEVFRAALRRYCRERGIGGREPSATILGRQLLKCCPLVVANQRRRDGAKLIPVYKLPAVDAARREWDMFIGRKEEWGV